MEASKFYGVIGDMNPIDHGGGVVFEGDYGPELIYFQGWSDDNGPRVTVSRFSVEENVPDDLDWVDWEAVARSIDVEAEALNSYGTGSNVLARAQVYEAVGMYCGFGELDPQPLELTLEEAEEQYGDFVDRAHESSRKAG